MKKYISSVFCSLFLILSACPKTSIPNVIPSDSNIQSTSLYTPVKVTFDFECTTQKNKVAYDIKADGTFSYVETVTSDTQTSNLTTRKLSANEIYGLNVLLKKADIVSLANKSTLDSTGAPQTTECRTVETYTFNVDGRDRTFDLNGRNIIHTTDYLDYLNSIKSYLEQLKKNPNSQPQPNTRYVYDFPLRISTYNDCSLGMASKTSYQINQDGNFYYTDDTTGNNLNRALSTQELSEVKELLLNLDLAQLSEKDIKNTTSDFQANECRDIKELALLVNNQNRTFDFNGKIFIHSYEYQSALLKLEAKLAELKHKNPNSPTTSHTYGLTLKVTSVNECMNSIPPSLYEVYESGNFSYKDPYSGALSYKTLSSQEITNLKNLLNRLDIATLATKDVSYSSNSIQTGDCKITDTVSFVVDGRTKDFSMNDRLASHSADYISALNSVESYLRNLATSSPTPTPTPISSTYQYDLPLKVTMNGECWLGDTTTYEVSSSGYFSYADPNATSGTFSVNPISSRQLTYIEKNI